MSNERDELAELLGSVWDEGNATGLDGWVGPGRGTLPVDDQAVSNRERDVQKYADAILAAGYVKRRTITTLGWCVHEAL